MIGYRVCIVAIMLLSIVSGCQDDAGTQEITTIAIEDPVRHYSPVIQGLKQEIAIKVYNTGDNLLRIFKVYPSCGCTIATFPESAIAPGEYGIVELEYDSTKNIGYVGVYTTIVTNTKDKANTVFFDLNVVPHADYTRDYEELYFIQDDDNNSEKIEDIGSAHPNKKGYTTSPSKTL